MVKKIALSFIVSTSLLNAAGYKIPEQSSDSLALSASNVATSFGPDAAYYNPANMMFLPDTRHYFENSVAWFHIDSLKFKAENGKKFKSNKFDSLATTFHFVSPEYYENWRFGLSLAVPAAVGIGWRDNDPAFTGKHFKLKVVELNPSVAYRVTDNFAIAAGARAVYSKGRIVTELYSKGDRAIWGDGIDYGYNVAMTYKPTENWSLAATYRSKVDLNLKGSADITSSVLANMLNYSGSASVSIPLPAVLTLATSYKIADTTLLFAYDRTYWSAFSGYDFEYDGAPNNPGFAELFDNKVERSYRDTNTFRFGVAHDLNEKVRLMAGFVYDQKAAKDAKSSSFDLPDSNSRAYSLGVNYKFSENLELALSGLYQTRQSTNASLKVMQGGRFPSPSTDMSGEFEKGKIWILGLGLKYKF
ncbi:OmpP1/FadL family transporter [Campylobacter mucosalis]|uniref:OmpP1/FadL family transporter n=1 Tax=Campylobacter mucosalis TaxID=202 RepID=UPI0014703C1D|nr:outer membrane protein transport protein [Campylobacter mucosalis]